MVIPKPKQYKESGILNILPYICLVEEFSSCKKAFSRIAYKIFGLRFKEGEDGIYVKFKPDLDDNQYEISGNTVYAKTNEGASYGLSTMLQLLERNGDSYLLKNTEILDAPDNKFRCIMIDLGRRFHEFETLLSYVDLCYVNKVKFLQLHLTDNEIWTLPLQCLPEVASKGKSYTKKELEYLVEYAKEAEIELVPEFEGIGHSAHLNSVYPTRFGNEYDTEKSTETDGAINVEASFVDNIMCIGRPTIFEDIKAMLTEIAEIFKYSKYIHIGCDEARHQNWLSCKHCRKYMEENGLKTTRDTYSHFAKKIIDICFSVGRTPIVWEGFPKEGSEEISRDTIVVSWENFYQTTKELLDGGFKIINASWKPLYIVPADTSYAGDEDLNWSIPKYDWNLYKWDNWAKFSKAYGGIEIEQNENVLGGMLCAWCCTYEEEILRVIKDLPALSDRTWNTTDFIKTEDFDNAVKKVVEIERNLV